MIRKSSVRYFNNTAIRAIWDKSEACWFYSAVDVVSALTNRIDDRELFMKGIDYSYYYEEIDN